MAFATATWGPEIEEFIPVAQKVSRLAQELGDLERAFQAQWLLYVAAMTLGDAEWVARVGDEHRALAERLKEPSQRWDEAERHFEEALAMNARMGPRPSLAHTQRDRALMLRARGQPGGGERARVLLAGALATYAELGMRCSVNQPGASPEARSKSAT